MRRWAASLSKFRTFSLHATLSALELVTNLSVELAAENRYVDKGVAGVHAGDAGGSG